MAEQMPLDLGDEKAVKALRSDAKRAAELRRETVIQFMSTEGGRAWFFDLLTRAHVYANPFSPDSNTMAFRCGELNIGQQVLSEVEGADPELYLLMMKESRK